MNLTVLVAAIISFCGAKDTGDAKLPCVNFMQNCVVNVEGRYDEMLFEACKKTYLGNKSTLDLDWSKKEEQ